MIVDGDHPRPCGEQRTFPLLPAYPQGSPPPMRGTVTRHPRKCGQNRITPAHAGNSGKPVKLSAMSGDHPRPCGEQQIKRLTSIVEVGSPPPMRGTVVTLGIFETTIRITPAHAGNSLLPSSKSNVSQDHPRPCGEQWWRRQKNSSSLGSPPPMRGTAEKADLDKVLKRITPAHAGNSSFLF